MFSLLNGLRAIRVGMDDAEGNRYEFCFSSRPATVSYRSGLPPIEVIDDDPGRK